MIGDTSAAAATAAAGPIAGRIAGPLDRAGWTAVKRGLDLLLAPLLLLLALPLLAVAAVAIVVADGGGPVLYSQLRLGRDGRPFRLWKLRTMRRNAEHLLARALTTDPLVQAEWTETCKLARDPRILPWVGAPLRRFAIDELPQLWNVLRGDLSLVGPRPLPAYHQRLLPPGVRLARLRVRPGLTGLWQVARRDHSLDELARLDLAYVTEWSLRRDLLLLLRTPLALAGGRHCR